MSTTLPRPFVASLKIWIAGALLSPVFYILITLLTDPIQRAGFEATSASEWLALAPNSLGLTTICSLPSAAVLYTALVFMSKRMESGGGFWVSVLVLTGVLAVSPFYVIFSYLNYWLPFEKCLPAFISCIAAAWMGVFWVYRSNPQAPALNPVASNSSVH